MTNSTNVKRGLSYEAYDTLDELFDEITNVKSGIILDQSGKLVGTMYNLSKSSCEFVKKFLEDGQTLMFDDCGMSNQVDKKFGQEFYTRISETLKV